jgi:hypothetical protein
MRDAMVSATDADEYLLPHFGNGGGLAEIEVR